MERRRFLLTSLAGAFAAPLAPEGQQPTRGHHRVALISTAEAQQAGKAFQIGVILHGGSYRAAAGGLREGLRSFGLEEGKQWVLVLRETEGDLNAVEQEARDLARRPVDLLYTVAGSVTQRAVRATSDLPIVFAVGSDPITLGLVQSLNRPGTRLTGIHFLLTDLTPKRLQLLKEIMPNARRVVTFYDPTNKGAAEAARLAREAAAGMGMVLLERHVGSVDDLRRSVQALKSGEVDAYFFTSDAMVASQTQFIIDMARARRLPTMFHEQGTVTEGGLASYGLSFREVGRRSAQHVIRIMGGARPHDLPVERVDRLEFAINLKTAKALGLTIPPSVLARADHVIE
jgi:putative ABC transport system substrate-binding protein